MNPKTKIFLRKTFFGRTLFEKNAFAKSKTRGLTTPNKLAEKARRMQAQLKRHDKATKKQVTICKKKIKLIYPLTAQELIVGWKDALGVSAFNKKLLKHPKTAAMLAERFRSTKDAEYFEKIARRAEYNAFMKKHGASGKKLVKMQAELHKK